MRKILLACAALASAVFVAPAPVIAQSQSDISAFIAQTLPDNQRGAITAQSLRSVLNQINSGIQASRLKGRRLDLPADPTTTDLADGETAIAKNTTTGRVSIWQRDGSAVSDILKNLFFNGCYPIETFGGKADGVTDNKLALNRLYNAISGNLLSDAGDTGFCVSYGAGTYYFSGPASFTYPSAYRYAVAMRGAGASTTTFKFASNSGLAFVLSGFKHSAHLSGINFVTTTTDGGGHGLDIVQKKCLGPFSQSTFSDLQFEGANGSSYWGSAAYIAGLSGTSWNSITVYGDDSWQHGNGIAFNGNPTDCGSEFGYSIYHNITHSVFNQLNIGILYGNFTQGVTINQTNFQNGNYGIFQPVGATAANVQLNVSNSQFQVGIANVQINTGMRLSSFVNNTFLMGPNPGVVGLDLKGSDLTTITGNTFNTIAPSGPGGVGVNFNASAATIDGNTFSGLTTGVNLQTGSQNNTIGTNTFNIVSTPYINAGTGNKTPTERGTATAAVTSCSPQGIFVPHNLPGTPLPTQVQATLALPATGAANFSNPSVMVTGTSANSVTVTFQCGTLGSSGNILINVASSLSK